MEGICWEVRERTLILSFPLPYWVLSWAPLRGGICRAQHVINCQVPTGGGEPWDPPDVYLQKKACRLGLSPLTVGMMTGVAMERLTWEEASFATLQVSCFATVGCSNALAVGDRGEAFARPSSGTINLVVVCSEPLSLGAMVEAVEVVTEAKVRALYEGGVRSVVSGLRATGTGTDCVAIACPPGKGEHLYCGKHTKVGELIGRTAFSCVARGLKKAGGL